MAETPTPQTNPEDDIISGFNKAIGYNPSQNTSQGNYNPLPESANIATQIKGNPITGPNPGLKNPVDTSEFVKSMGSYVKGLANTNTDPHDYMKPFSYNGDYDGANFERYYGTKQFNKLGFNPYRDNDALYNDNRTFGDDFSRAASQWPSLLKSGFMSGLRSWGDMFSDPLAPDLKSAREMSKAMAIGSSTKGGVGGFINNTFLNSAYTVGIGGELLLEELALAGATALTGGALSEMTVPAMLARAGMAGRALARTTEAGRAAIKEVRAGEEVLGTMKNLNNMSDIRTFFGAVINPLENTWEVGKDLVRGTNGLGFTTAAGKVQEFARWSDNFGKFAKDMIMIKSAVSESKLEGGMVQMDVIKNLTDKYREENNGKEPEGEEVVKIEKIAKEEAKRTALWNMPAILWSNKLMYETIFAPFEKGAAKVSKDIVFDEAKKAFVPVGEGLMERASAAGKSLLQPKTYGKFAMGYLKTNAAEGVQENIQEAISTGAIAHAEAIYKDPNRGMYEGYMGHFLNGMKEQFSGQGAETFAGGFLMGAMAQPMMGAPMWAGKKVWDSTVGKKKYEEYKKTRDEQLAKTSQTLNELYTDPMKYFAPELASLTTQDDLAVDMHRAVDEADKNNAKDVDDIASFQHIYTALESGHYDTVLDKFEEFKNYTPEEAAQAFNLPDAASGAKALAKIDNIINRAKEIKTNHDEVSSNYPNPYNPGRFKTGTADYKAQAYSYHAWEKAKMNLIFAKQSFTDHSSRLEQMANELSTTSRPLEKTSAQEFMVLLDPRATAEYAKNLANEVKNLDSSIPEQRKIITAKQKQLELLKDFQETIHIEENLKQHYFKETLTKEEFKKVGKRAIPIDSYVKVSGKESPQMVSTPITNKAGTVTGYKVIDVLTGEESEVKTKDINYLKPTEAAEIHGRVMDRTSRKSFNNYLSHLAKQNGDFFFNNRIEKAYNLIKDHMLVKDEMGYLVESINVLNNPKGFLKLQGDLKSSLQRIHEEVAETIKKNQDEFVLRIQSNKGTNMLMEKTGLVPTPPYFDKFILELREGKLPLPPTIFLDAQTFQPIESGERFTKGLDVWKDVLEVCKKEEAPEVVPGTEETKTETTQVITDVPSKIINTKTTPLESYPDELYGQVIGLVDDHMIDLGIDEETQPELYKAEVAKFMITPKVQSIVDNYNAGIQPAVNWSDLINKAVNERELDRIMDQLDAAGAMTPDLSDAIAQKRSAFKATPVSDIEDKKADIERRRQEELKSLPRQDRIDKAKEELESIITKSGKSTALQPLQNRIDALEAMSDYHEAKDKINAKYDAELAALEKPSSFKVTSVTTEESPEAQKKAESAINRIKKDTAGATKDSEGYTIQGELYNNRVTTAAAKILKEEFDFTKLGVGKAWLATFDRMHKDKEFTPEALIKELKSDVSTKSAFQAIKGKSGKDETRFTNKKIDILLNGSEGELVGLNEDPSRDNFITLINELAYKESTIRGNTVDNIARDFFETGSAVKPEGISQEAFDKLIPQLENLRSIIQSRGEIILTNGLIVYGANDIGGVEYKVAGEMDLLVITPEGQYKIYDVKTADTWKNFPGSSKQERYSVQLSLYQNLLEKLTGIPVVAREIFPILTTTDDDGYIKDIGDAKKQVDTKSLELKYNPKVELYVPKYTPKAAVQPSVTQDTLGQIQTIVNSAPSLVALDNIQSKIAPLAQQLSDEALIVEEDMDLANVYIDAVDAMITKKQDELLKDINEPNLKWAASKSWTVTYEPMDKPQSEFSIKSVGKDTVKVSKLGETYDAPITSIISINRPGTVAPEFTITEDDEKIIKSNNEARTEVSSDPAGNADDIDVEVNKGLDALEDELDNIC